MNSTVLMFDVQLRSMLDEQVRIGIFLDIDIRNIPDCASEALAKLKNPIILTSYSHSCRSS